MELKDRRAKDATKALLILEQGAFSARFAGGCVRDRLMGAQPMDFDIATDATPEETSRVFQTRGFKVIPTGIDHGTVTVIAPSGPIEITTLRRDVETDGRRAQVAFGKSFEEDAERRDFTINAMFEDARGKIYDYHGGQKDLAAKLLRFVGHGETRIREDYLRILRLFRFWAKLGFNPVPGTLEEVAKEKTGLKGISQERITSELLKTLGADFAGAPLQAMHHVGVCQLVMPELSMLQSGEKKSPLPGSFWPLPQLVPDSSKGLAALAAACLWEWDERQEAMWTQLGLRLRLSRADTKAFAFFPSLINRLSGLGPERADALLLAEECDHHGGKDGLAAFYAPTLKALAEAKLDEVLPLMPQLERCLATDVTYGHLWRNSPPVAGKDLMATLGLTPGPALGEALNDLRRSYLNGLWSTREEGLIFAQKTRKG